VQIPYQLVSPVIVAVRISESICAILAAVGSGHKIFQQQQQILILNVSKLATETF
jgi:hypothetical protein